MRQQTKKGVLNSILAQKKNVFKSSFVKKEIIFVFNIIDIFFKEPDYSFGRKKKFSDKAILKILILLKMFDKSYRKSEEFFENNYEYLTLIGIDEIPSFQTISYRANKLDFRKINNDLINWIYNNIKLYKTHVAIDANIISPCKPSRWGKAKSSFNKNEFGFTYTTKGKKFGKKLYLSLDVNNDFIFDFTVAKASIHESKLFDELFISIKSFSIILLDAAYDSYYIFSKIKSSGSIPAIDLNNRNTKYYESYNRYVMKSFRIVFKDDYKLRWEIEHVNGIMDAYFGTEYVWYVRNRNYLTFAGITVVLFNLIFLFNLFNSYELKKVSNFFGP